MPKSTTRRRTVKTRKSAPSPAEATSTEVPREGDLERPVNGDVGNGVDDSGPSGESLTKTTVTSEEANGVEEEGKDEQAKMTMDERKARMDELRQKMQKSFQANRASLIEETSKAKVTVREAARLDRQRKLAEILRSKADAEERGEDVERAKNWDWTIEENDEWERKKAKKARRADFEFHNDAHAARRRYKKDLDLIKPDLVTYNRQKEIAMGLAPGTLVRPASAPSTPGTSTPMEVVPTREQQLLAAENLYRDANTLMYADNKPSEEAIDRVVGKLNRDLDKKSKFSRKRPNEDKGDITYINEHNRVFNKKIARYYDKYTAEIRASFERGTAL